MQLLIPGSKSGMAALLSFNNVSKRWMVKVQVGSSMIRHDGRRRGRGMHSVPLFSRQHEQRRKRPFIMGSNKIFYARHFSNSPPAKAVDKEGETEPKPPPTIISRDSLERLVELSKREWKLIGMSAATLGVTSSITLLIPYVSGQVIDFTAAAAAASSSSGGSDGGLSSMIMAVGGLFGLTALAGGGVYLRTLWLERAGNRIVARLKQQFYGSLLQQESAFIDQQTTGDLLSRLSADAQLVQYAVTTEAVAGLRNVIMSIGSATMLLYTSPTLAALSCCTLPPIFIISRSVGRKLKIQQEEVQILQGEANTLAEQSISNISTVKQFVAEEYETVRYQNAIARAHSKAIDTAHMQAQLQGITHVTANGAMLCVLGYGGNLVLAGSITAGDLAGFVMYSLLMAGNLSALSSLYGNMAQALGAADRVFDVLDRKPLIPAPPPVSSSMMLLDDNDGGGKYTDPLLPAKFKADPITAKSKRTSPVSIEFKDLSFEYPKRPDVQVLDKLNLTVAPGEILALVGGSGSGKSTIAGLLTRLYDVSEDSILINGKSVRAYRPQDLRRMIGIVSQEPALFRGTIRDNIAYGEWENASEEQIWKAAKLAHVLEFAESFPDGLDTMLDDSRRGLSGGQRQRVALARVLVKDPPLVILDEATSALDAQSEHLVQEAMNTIFTEGGHTVLSIAHRLSTIRSADRIAVLEYGRIVQTGTFDELTSKDGPFRELMRTQLVGDINDS